MLFQGFNEFWKSEKKYLIMSFPWIFFRAWMKGMLDGLFKFLKSEKHLEKTYPSHGFIFKPTRWWVRWAFQVLESLKST